MTNIEHLTRYPIIDLQEELTSNLVSPGRHREIINFYKKHLSDVQYYCLSPTNPMRPKVAYSGTICSRTYRCANHNISQYFALVTVNILGNEIKALKQEVYPKKASDFRLVDDYVIYVSKNEIDQLIKKI